MRKGVFHSNHDLKKSAGWCFRVALTEGITGSAQAVADVQLTRCDVSAIRVSRAVVQQAGRQAAARLPVWLSVRTVGLSMQSVCLMWYYCLFPSWALHWTFTGLSYIVHTVVMTMMTMIIIIIVNVFFFFYQVFFFQLSYSTSIILSRVYFHTSATYFIL